MTAICTPASPLYGFSYRELSNETGIPVSYLYDTVKRAKDEIKKCIKYDE